MLIYLLRHEVAYESGYTLGVYSTRELAKKAYPPWYGRNYGPLWPYDSSAMTVIEIELDAQATDTWPEVQS